MFVKILPQQVPRRQPRPPLVVVCPPPSPRLVNVHGEEELDFRNSSTLCLWSWDPRESGHKESGIPVEVNDAHRRVYSSVTIRSVYEVKFISLVLKTRQMSMENCLPKLTEYQLHPILTEAAKTKSHEEHPTPLPPVQSAASNSSNRRTITMLILLNGIPPVEEYLFMMTKLGSRDCLVNFDKLQKSTLSKL